MASSSVSDILRSLDALESPIRASGFSRGAAAFLLARRSVDSGQGGVVLCPDDDTASDLAQRIEALSAGLLGESVPALHFPGWDSSPYSPIALSIRTRLTRAGALAALTAEERPSRLWVCTTPSALFRTTLPRELWSRSCFALASGGQGISRDELVGRLQGAGYLRVETVEDPGTFSVRGDIVDVFTPDRSHPLRIELFGDEIERIREFNASSQRAVGDPLLRCRICPAREVLILPDTGALLRERIKAFADDRGVPRPVRDPVLQSVTEGVASDHADAWAAFAYPEPETLQDYLESVPGDWVCFDELTLKQQWDQFLEEAREQSADVLRTGVLVPPPNQLFRWDTAADLRLKERTRLYLDQLALTDAADVGVANVEEPENLAKPGQPSPPKARHAVQVRENGELAASGPKNAFAQLLPRLALWKQQGFRIVVACGTESQAERARFLLQENGHAARIGAAPEPGQIVLTLTSLPEGFRWPAEGIVLLAEHELFGTRQARKAARRPRSESGSAAQDWSGLQALADLSVNDAVVHSEHGIGLYRGLVRLELSGAPADFLQLEYAGKDRLYLPVYRLNVLQKYVGSGEAAPLDRLGSQQFAKAKEKVRDAVRTLAIDLVKLYAERAMRPGERFGPRDPEYGEFEARFAFEETPDQLRAIETVLDDLESGRPMDRLVCGDVGYGKTEVAMRAAYRAVSEGKQVAVLVPTTILAHQHEQSFRARFRDTPVQIDSVSRFKTAKDQKEVLRALADGKLDIVIGTHRLLSRDVAFRNLGLVIVDEEHRFGVEHKERLKALKVNTHVLTLTATPIPRTLHMALSGLRDISIINTPPVDRLPIRTFVSRYDESLIQRAIAFELGRGGQVFFLHNRVQTIHQTAETLTRLVPHARVGIAHGQMAESELENAMLAFYRRETQVLVCTTIIESGIDVPSANTLIVSRADALGLAQLYQIRGRVGRGQQRAYAYLLIPPEAAISTDARKRLEVLQKFVELGAGFSVASHDLEIRGGGDLLGPQQSGHIAAVGFDLYTQLLEEAIAELRTETGKTSSATTKPNEPEIKVPFPAFLSEEYIPDVHQRLSLYRRLSAAEDEATLDRLEAELGDRFGRLPEPASNLLWLIRIKQWLKSTGIDSLSAGRERVSLVSSGAGSRLNPARAIALVASRPADFQLTPDSKFVAKIPTDGIKELYFGLLALGKLLA